MFNIRNLLLVAGSIVSIVSVMAIGAAFAQAPPAQDEASNVVAAPLTAAAQHNATIVLNDYSQNKVRFRVKLAAPIDTKTAIIGDIVEGQLVEATTFPDGTVVPAGTNVEGQVTCVDRARSVLKSDIPTRHWRNANGGLGLKLTSIILGPDKTMELNAIPAPHVHVERINPNAQALETDAKGDIIIPFHTARYTMIAAALEGAGIAAGPFGIVGAPVVSGLIGAVDPAYAYGHPVAPFVTHPHLKGFFKGAVAGLPGGILISGITNHGVDVALAAGDIITFQATTETQ